MALEADAIELAQSMIAAGEGDGKPTTAFVTAMDQPLGRAIGNWLEVVESIRTLSGQGPEDLTDLSVALAGQMLVQANPGGGKGGAFKKGEGRFSTLAAAKEQARAQIENGEALAAFRALVQAQGGDVAVVDSFASSPHGPEAALPNGGARGLEVYQAIFGADDATPAALRDVELDEAPHGCFWGPPCQGLEGCRSLEAFFRRADGSDPPPDGDRLETPDERSSSWTSVKQSQRAPHGPTVGRVCSLDALAIGRACIGIGAGRQKMGEALSLGSGVLLHKKVGDELRQGDVLFTLFAEVGGTSGSSGTRRIIDQGGVDAACERILSAYGFVKGAELEDPVEEPSPLIRCFIDRDGSVTRL